MFGLALDDAELTIFQQCSGRTAPAPGGYLEATLVIGRRGGKSLILALIAAFLAAFYDWSPYLTGGERGTIMVVAADRKQARSIFRYLKEMLSIPLLARMIERETAELRRLVEQHHRRDPGRELPHDQVLHLGGGSLRRVIVLADG